jgi:hypothetical protein
MDTRSLKSFVKNNQDEILKKVEELQNFGPTDIGILKNQIERGIRLRRKMKVVPFAEMKDLYIGFIAIRVVQKERGYA